MWTMPKYDSLEPFRVPMIKKLFPRYISILFDDMPANFIISKRIVFDFDTSMDTTAMWKEHKSLMKIFHQTKEAIDKGKLSIDELEIPRFSLLDLKILLTETMLHSCNLCERNCGVNRIEGQKGKCGVESAKNCTISSEGIHLGEEPHIKPSHTVFFMGCNLECQYCQNWEIARWKSEVDVLPPAYLAKIIGIRKWDGARNVNWVGGEPTPQLMCFLRTLKISGTNTPQIWNSNFYMSEETMAILEGMVDMYLSDFKYGNDDCAEKLSMAKDYMKIVKRNHKIAAKQAEMTVRHLVLPDHVDCCTKPVMKWLSKNIRTKALVNVMDQYMPRYMAKNFVSLKRRVNEDEMKMALKYAKKMKLKFVH